MKKINLYIDEKKINYSTDNDEDKIFLYDIAKEIENDYRGYITLAIVDNKLRELTYEVTDGSNVKFLDTTNMDGRRVYNRTMAFIFIMACKEVFNDSKVVIEHSLSGGLYCDVYMDRSLKEEDVEQIRMKMNEIIKSNYKIEKIITDKKEAISMFESYNMEEKARLLEYKEYDDVKIYRCNDNIDHFYGYMLPSTGYIKFLI